MMQRVVIVRDATRLKVVHRQRVLRQGDAEPAPEFDAGALSPAVLAGARSGWQQLLETEYESVVIAGWMTAALARLGAPLDIVGAFGRVVEDEIRHVDICAQMLERLGSTPTVPQLAPPPFPAELCAGTAAEFETVAGMVSFFCVFEHLSGLVFQRAQKAAKVPLAQWAISEIFRDEAFHGAFGFETARVYVPRWSEAQRQALGERVAADVRRFEQRLRGAGQAESPRDTAALELLGLLSPPALLQVFQAGVYGQLLPKLAELEVLVVL